MDDPRLTARLSISPPAGLGALSPESGGSALTASGDRRSSGQLVEQARILSLMYDIGKELTSILDLEALLRAIGDHVKRLVDHDLFNVMLLNEEIQRLEHRLTLQYDERINLRRTLALGEGLCGTAALERRPVRVGSVASDPRYILCDGGLGVQSELVVPLIVKDRLLGVLDFESLHPDAFTQEHEQVLATLASTVAIAMENALLYDQLRRAERRRGEDLEQAREVQRLLLPKETPQIPGAEIAVLYIPAQELGGDFFDFLPYGDGRMAIAVGDVAGKGPAAALLASMGVGILREHAGHHPSPPAEMLADLNGHLQTAGSAGRFIALVLGVYDSATRELCLASAGFPHPILVRDNTATPVLVGGVPLGLLSSSSYEPVCLHLQPGDVVVFCSDGIHEQTNYVEEEFGVARLATQLAAMCQQATAGRIAADIVKAIDLHAGGGAAVRGFTDDRTIVVLRVTGASS